jgi:AcrR family transcriptional regulator
MREDTLKKVRDDPNGVPARILAAAEEVFGEFGYAGASTREIARRAGVPFGALHYYWGSKMTLKQAVLQRWVERSREIAILNLEPQATLSETIGKVSDAFFNLLVQNRNATRFMLRGLLEPLDPHSQKLFGEWTKFGLDAMRALGLKTQDVGAIALVATSMFLTTVAAEAAQEMLLGGTVFKSPQAQDRVRQELRRMGRKLLDVSE